MIRRIHLVRIDAGGLRHASFGSSLHESELGCRCLTNPRNLHFGPDGFDGLIQTFTTGFGPVTTFDQDYSAIVNLHIRGNDMYALETFAPDTPWTPGTGRVVHRVDNGSRTVIACGLNFPIGMTRRGNELFVSIASHGQGPVTGLGQIVRVRL